MPQNSITDDEYCAKLTDDEYALDTQIQYRKPIAYEIYGLSIGFLVYWIYSGH
jgi:hypothetical protein